MNGNIFDADGISPSLTTNKGEGIKIKSATKKGFEVATEGDSINLSNLSSETRRGRVGKEVAQTLDTNCAQAVIINPLKDKTNKDKYPVKSSEQQEDANFCSRPAKRDREETAPRTIEKAAAPIASEERPMKENPERKSFRKKKD